MPSLETINPKIKILLLILAAVFLIAFIFFVYQLNKKPVIPDQQSNATSIRNEKVKVESFTAEEIREAADKQASEGQGASSFSGKEAQEVLSRKAPAGEKIPSFSNQEIQSAMNQKK